MAFEPQLKKLLRFDPYDGQQITEAISALEKLAVEARGTPVSAKAKEAAVQIRQDRDAAVVTEMRNLKDKADDLKNTDLEAAIAIYEGYSGPWIRETQRDRARLASALKRRKPRQPGIPVPDNTRDTTFTLPERPPASDPPPDQPDPPATTGTDKEPPKDDGELVIDLF